MSCEIFSINGESHSILAETLNKINNNNSMITKSQMEYFRSKSFLNDFGDYITAKKSNYEGDFANMLSRVDDNGEPKLEFDENEQKYFFTDKENKKVYFPIKKNELRNVLSYEHIEVVTSRLAKAFFDLSGLDFNNINMESGEKLPDLSSFIEKELNKKVKEAIELEDYGKAAISKELLNHVDNLTEEVENLFKRMSLVLKDDPDYDELTGIEESTKDDPGFGKQSFERDSKANINKNIKLRLSLLENGQVLDPIFNEPTFQKFSSVYSALATVLTDQVVLQGEDIFEIYKDNILQLSSNVKYLKKVYEYISDKKFSEESKNEFVQSFNLHKNNYQASKKTTNEKGEIKYTTTGISDSGNKTSSVINAWFNDFKSKFLNSDNDLKKDSLDRIKLIDKKFNELKSEFKDLKDSEKYIEKEEFFINSFVDNLNDLGITISPEGLSTYLDNYGKDISINHRIEKLQEFVFRITKATDSIINTLSKLKDKEPVNNSIISSKTSRIIDIIAKAEALHIEDGTDATVRFGNKQQWIYSYPSYLSTKIKQWKKNPELLLDLLNQSAFNQGSFLLKYLAGIIDEKGNKYEYKYDKTLDSYNERLNLSRERLGKFDLSIFGQMTVDDDFSPTNELSFKDYVQDNVNKVLLNDFVRTITQADKGTEYQIKTGLRVDAFEGYEDLDGKFIRLIDNSVKKQFSIDYFGSEYNRMIEADKQLSNSPDNERIIHYHYKKGTDVNSRNGNAFKSQLFEKLSPGYEGELSEQEKQLHKDLYLDGKPILENGINEDMDKKISERLQNYIESELIKNIDKTFKSLIDNEIITIDENRNAVLTNLDQSIINKYNNLYGDISKNSPALAMATDYYINSVMQAIEYTKLFSGDMAYYKDAVDFKKRIPATYTDGMQLRIKPGEEDFNVAIIDSVIRESPYLEALREGLQAGADPYEDINSADAQAWITPERWKFLIKRLGKWTEGIDSYESVYNKMQSTEPVEYTQKELKLAAQPLKGVYFYRDQTGVPVFLKYSQAVLSKQMVSGSDLERLFDKMNKQGIDEVITLDGIKVGAMSPTTIHNSDGNLISEENPLVLENGEKITDFELNSMTLDNRGWKLQQDLPTKTYKDIDTGSQIQKNIFQGLIHNINNDNFFLDNKFVNGGHVIDEIVKTVGNMSNNGLSNFKKEFGINDNGEIKNIKSFYNALIKDLEKREGSQNLIDGLKSQIALPGLPQAGSKLVNIFSSIVKDRIVKIKTNGGSFIQMSNFGLNKIQGNKIGVKWAPDSSLTTAPPLLYVDKDGKARVKPGSVLVPASFIAKHIPDWNEKTPEQLFGEYDKDGNLVKEGLIDSRILENIIGYRIPNQGLASNSALKIAGILPEGQGDTIVAYTEITKQTGSDFDVDKMYIMFPKTKHNDGRLEYDNEDDGNRLIELYKSVLTHPDVYKDVMKPVDSPLFSDAINSFDSSDETGNLHHFDPFEDMNLRYLFLDGKAGVGMLANAIVDISRTGKLTLKDNFIGWGNSEDETTVFNKEFSEELNDTDLNYYTNVMSKFKKNFNEQDFKKSTFKVKLGDSLTYVLNGFVDIVKDPFITKGNWGTSTTNVGTFLIRAGVHPLKVIHFMSQPIIKKFVKFQKNLEGLGKNEQGNVEELFKSHLVTESLSDINIKYKSLYEKYYRNINNDLVIDSLTKDFESGAISKTNFDDSIARSNARKKKAYKELIDFYKGDEKTTNETIKLFNKEHNKVFKVEKIEIQKASLEQFRYEIKSVNKLKDQLKEGKITQEEFDIKMLNSTSFQINVLNTFKDIQQLSKGIRENVMLSKLDTDAGGKNINGLFKLFNLRNFIKSKENNKGSLVGVDNKFENSTLQVFYNNIEQIGTVINANPELFPQGQFKVQDMFNEISRNIYGQPLINDDLANKLEIEYLSFIMSNFEPFNLSKESKEILIKDLPKIFREFQKKYPDNFMLKELQVKQPSVYGKQETIILNNKQKDSVYEKAFVDSWKDLLISEPQFAEDLIKYSFVTSNFKMNAEQFFTYIPSSYLVSKDINRYISNFVNLNQSLFIDLFFRNNLSDKKYVKKLSYNTQYGSLTQGFNSLDKGFFLEGDIENANYYVEREVKEKDINGKDIKRSIYYKLEGYRPRIVNGEVIGYRPLYFAINPSYISLNSRKLSNYSFTNNEDLYIDPVFVKSVKNSIIKMNEDPEYKGNMYLRDRNNINENIVTSSQEVLEKPIETKQEVESEVSNMNELTNHSGGAKGGDMVWDNIGREFGVTNHNHYTTKYFDNLLPKDQVELSQQYLETVKWLKRGVINSESYAGKLVRRDMIQANNGDAIFGVTELVKPGINGRKGYSNKNNYSIPEGSTGYAVTRGILSNKPTYVFNQSNNYGNEIGWYKWDNKINDFIKTNTPILTKNFTGIGSQEINDLGIQAIREVYEKTFKEGISKTISNKPQQLSLFDSILNEERFNEVKDKWESSGRTKEEWDLMSQEEREYLIKNCL